MRQAVSARISPLAPLAGGRPKMGPTTNAKAPLRQTQERRPDAAF